jgi:hypothetical protein
MDTKLTVTMDKGLVEKASAAASRQGWDLQDLLRSLITLVAGERPANEDLELLLEKSQACRPLGVQAGERLRERLRQAWKRSDEYLKAHPPPPGSGPLKRDEIYEERLSPRRS